MDHVHKSRAGLSRLTKSQAEFRAELVKDSLVKRREREMCEAIDRAVARFCRTAEDEAQLRATFDLVHAPAVSADAARTSTFTPTPGPWRADWPDVWGTPCVYAGKVVIAEVATIDSSFPPDGPTGKANAFLMAAAPDLLAALQRAADTFADVRKFSEMTSRHGAATTCEIAEAHARAAIAKAAV